MAIETITAAIFFVSAGATLLLTVLVRRVLLRRHVLDRPNARSAHDIPTPRGGGIAILSVLVPCWIAIGLVLEPPAHYWFPIVGAIALAALSFLDDLRGLGALSRLGAQATAVVVVLLADGVPGSILGGAVPGWVETVFCVLAWVWFINLFNFMDGIDGISGSETIAIAVGIVAIVVLAAQPHYLLAIGVALIGGGLGFLRWNWHRASIFMGDVGSIPLGFILGWLLLTLAARGYWAPALILPLYYLCDATYTLLRRAARREKIWQAHNQHFYQRAVRAGYPHDQVVVRISVANAMLVALACVALWYPWYATVASFFVVGGLLLFLNRMSNVVRPATAPGEVS